MSARRLAAMTVALVLLLVPFVARAQPLADRVPADALIYAGWRGAMSPGPGYEGSHLKAVLDASDLPKFFNEFLPQVLNRVGQESPEMAGATTVFAEVGRAVWRYPTALFVGPVDLNQNPPTPHAGVLIQAGDEADKLHRHLEALVQQAQRNVPFPIVTFNNGGLVGVVVGYRANDFQPPAAAGAAAAGLQGAQNFKAAMTAINGVSGVRDPVIAAYVDVDGVRAFAEQAIEKSGNAEAAQTWPKVRDALGLQGLKQITFVSGFSGKGWEDNLFVAAPPPRKGLLALLDAKPVSDDALRLIPRSARIANAVSFDLSRLLDEVRNVVGQLDPDLGRQIDDALRQASRQVGVDLEQDLFDSLGHEWVSYSAPSVGGNGLLGLVGVNRLKDPAKAQQTLTKLAEVANRVLEEQLKGEEVTVKLNTVQVDGMGVTYLATPIVSPAWTVRNGNLFVALYPQNVVAAARAAGAAPAPAPAGGARAMAAPGDGSILDNPDFVMMRQALAGQRMAGSISAIQYTDLRLTAPDAYPMWLAVSRLAGFGDLFGVQSPPMILPPLAVLNQHLGPAAAAAWSDDAGWHFRGYSPFPGSTILANDPLTTYFSSAGPSAIAVVLPSLNRAREQANRIKSASNLRQIGLGLLLYANEHDNKYPKDFAELLRTQDLTPDVFVNPRGSAGAAVPAGVTRENPGAVNGIDDYLYLGAGMDSRMDADVIVACENPDRVHDGVNILYGDGHVDFVPMEAARERIEKAKQARRGAGGQQ